MNTIPKEITRTSVNVPTALWEEMRVIAIRRKLTAGEAVVAAIRMWIRAEESAAGPNAY